MHTALWTTLQLIKINLDNDPGTSAKKARLANEKIILIEITTDNTFIFN